MLPYGIHLVAAARPNFMKIAPLYHILKTVEWASPVIVHTGQHYDQNMSGALLKDLGLPEPHIHLGVGSGSHSQQTGNVMIAYEKVLLEQRPDLVIVVGDVNSTLACTLAAAKVSYRSERAGVARPFIAHLEAGLRSFDRTMPEEINRLVTDAIADLLWTPSPDADANLRREGIGAAKIARVGNIMIDSLEMLRRAIEEAAFHEQLGLRPAGYAVLTLHRPGNVDNPSILRRLSETIQRVSAAVPLVFPVHPRTRKNLLEAGLMPLLSNGRIILTEPLSYIRFMSLIFNCKLAITDSGGIQEETTYLGIPCLTLRPNTERPITLEQGTNRLCDLDNLEKHVCDALQTRNGPYRVPDLWDGRTAGRIAQSIKAFLDAPAGPCLRN